MVDKPAGLTSFGVVARIRRVLSNPPYGTGKRVKVGHTGTLDPFATGLMILVTGDECKNAGKYSKMDKVYEATVVLGKNSTTGDPEGEITDVSDRIQTAAAVKKVLKKFTGQITQRPPAYSAIKIGGQRAYKLARTGETVEMPERKVKIYDLELISYEYPELKIRANVSSGTYIRSLVADIGTELGTGAYCKALRRVSIGDWKIAGALTLVDLGIYD